jgi:hypothetical protein
MHRLYVIGPRDKRVEKAVVVNTTSTSKDFGKAFSPFMCQGRIELGGLVAHNVENLWQGTKRFEDQIDDGEWINWRDSILSNKFAQRYPKGKGAKAICSIWNGKKLDYIPARKKIYVPAYVKKLKSYCEREVNSLIDMLSCTDIYLWDFDGYATENSWDEILNDPNRSLGHAFVLKKYIMHRLGVEF